MRRDSLKVDDIRRVFSGLLFESRACILLTLSLLVRSEAQENIVAQ